MNDRALEEKAIFLRAIEFDSEADRSSYLEATCGKDNRLRDEIEALLGAHERPSRLLDTPDHAAPAVDCHSIEERTGTLIGPYRLLEQMGEGGMGTVYMAEQTRPVRRKVALKVIKAGMDTRQVIARFEAERQALAMMDHPNIARVLDAGATKTGRPYFVMELVRGIPITDYCDRERLTIPERLDLFVLVCRAVQHAHQKGVIHRDLKPSNVQVTVIDGAAVPKVIDFGVAKATDGQLADRTLMTGFHQFVGTPLYMSPEQADLSGAGVDTRSDIYSLGVLLYELLTGTTPFDHEAFRKSALDEMRRKIRDVEPPRPSSRLSTLGETLAATSMNRSSDPKHLKRAVRGELDWIAMKALEKDRGRRYETANDFASDVMRHLTHRPVEACPPSRWYKLRTAVRRNRVTLATSAVVATALIAGTAASVWQARRAMRAEQRSHASASKAEAHAAEAQAVTRFLTEEVLALASPDRSRGGDVSVLEAIQLAADGMEDQFADQPLVEAAIRHTIARTLLEVSWSHAAVPHARKALALRRQNLGAEHAETLASMSLLAEILHDRENNALVTAPPVKERGAEARTLAEQVASVRRRLLGPDHADTLTARISLAHILVSQGSMEAGQAILESVYEITSRTQGLESELSLDALTGLAHAKLAKGESGAAMTRFQTVVTIHRGTDRAPRRLQKALRSLCEALSDQGRFDEAEVVASEALDLGARTLGLDHWNTDLALGSLLGALAKQGKGDEIRALHIRWLRKLEGTDPIPGVLAPKRLAGARLSQAITALTWKELLVAPALADKEACIRASEAAVKIDPNLDFSRRGLALAYYHAGRHDDAIIAARMSLEANKSGDQARTWSPISGRFILAMALHARGDRDAARAEFDRCITWMEENRREHGRQYWSLTRLRSQAEALMGQK